MRRAFYIIGVIILTLCAVAPAQNQGGQTTVQAEIDSGQAGVGEDVTYTVTVSGSNIPDQLAPNIPGLDNPNLQVVSSRQSRSMMSGSSFTIIINGRTVKQDKNAEEQVIFEYVIRARQPGTYNIGPASVTIDGREYTSKTLSFSVSSQPVAPTGITPHGDVFVHADVSPKRAYIGEQVIVKYYLYIRPNVEVQQLGQTGMPRLDGFIKNDFEQPTKFKVTSQSIGGQIYQEIFLGRLILFPITPGTRTIGRMTQGILQRERGRDHPIFGPQYFMKENQAESEPVSVDILPLPEEGKPASFSGAVGNFQLHVEADRREARVGESITFTINLTGDGNLQSASDPNLNLPAAIQAYPPEKSDQSSVVGNQIQSSRSMKYILVPQQEGAYEIGPVTFSYFNPSTGTYQEARSEALSLTVGAGVISGPRPNGGAPDGVEVTMLSQDIHYIKPDSERLEDESRPTYSHSWYWALHGLPIFMLVAAVFIRRRRDRLLHDVGYARRVRAKTVARRRLESAASAAKSGDASLFYLQTAEAVVGFVADQLDLKAAGLTSRDIFAKMNDLSISPDVIRRTTDLLARCDAARYAPTAESSETRDRDMEEAGALITELGKSFEKGAPL